jgi:hypothetical protein
VVAHGAILRIYEKKPLVADQVAINWRKADITPRQRAMLAFAMKVCQRSHEIDDADFAALREHGLDEEDAVAHIQRGSVGDLQTNNQIGLSCVADFEASLKEQLFARGEAKRFANLLQGHEVIVCGCVGEQK